LKLLLNICNFEMSGAAFEHRVAASLERSRDGDARYATAGKRLCGKEAASAGPDIPSKC
jgi:hypothetical protein